MKKFVPAIVAVVAMLAPVAVSAPASADTAGCVTKAEYRKVKKGMTKTKVHRIFDTAGKRQAIASSGGYSSEIRSYKTCQKYSAVAVSYDKKPGGSFKLSAKSAVWVG